MATETMKASATTERIGDEALKKKTGRDWQEWFSLLDKEGAVKLTHKEIVALVQGQLTLTSWWGQMIAVGYEQERGLRVPHEKPSGFEISVSKTDQDPGGYGVPAISGREAAEAMAKGSRLRDSQGYGK